MTQIRKKKKLSQADVGKLLDIDGGAYGRYERNKVKPCIEMAAKIADAFKVSLDYLIGKTNLEFDDDTLNRIEEISKLSDKNKEVVYTFLDSFLATSKIQGILKPTK
ncbi:MAG: helix-turn-helix domain-containing protein [Chitinophagaceae bacterium]